MSSLKDVIRAQWSALMLMDADVKIYLDASLDERAKRRLNQRQQGQSAEKIAKEQSELDRRDRADRERRVGPLRIPDDAIIVDTSNLTIDQQVDKVYQICSERITHDE